LDIVDIKGQLCYEVQVRLDKVENKLSPLAVAAALMKMLEWKKHSFSF